MLTYLLALLAACANAASSVLQRKANRDAPRADNLSWKLIRDLLRKPVWFGGILALTAGFLLQATALGTGGLATVEPVLVLELPLTLLLASRAFRVPLGWRELGPAAAMAAGLAGLLYALSPSSGRTSGLGWYVWVTGIGASLALVAALVAWARRDLARWRRGQAGSGSGEAAVLGVAAGSAFGLTAALMKGMTQTMAGGFAGLFTSWPLYAMIATGMAGMFLAQSALNAGRLVAAQPGLSLSDPIISILWGVLAFGERVRGGLFILLDVVSLGAMAAGVLLLARSPLLDEHSPARPPGDRRDEQAAQRPGGRRAVTSPVGLLAGAARHVRDLVVEAAGGGPGRGWC